MHPLYLDISSDKVYLSYNDEELFLERNGIEDILGKVLIQRRRKYHFTKAYILNWPWGFTNVRVGSLCINLLNTLVDEQIDLYSVSKIELFSYEFQENSQHQQEGYPDKIPPRKYGVIYIGQKRNIWLWDFEKGEKVWQMNFDKLKQIIEEEGIKKEDIFLDVVYDYEYYPDFLKTFLHTNYTVTKQLMRRYAEVIQPHPTKHIEANYMIDPIIGEVKQL